MIMKEGTTGRPFLRIPTVRYYYLPLFFLQKKTQR